MSGIILETALQGNADRLSNYSDLEQGYQVIRTIDPVLEFMVDIVKEVGRIGLIAHRAFNLINPCSPISLKNRIVLLTSSAFRLIFNGVGLIWNLGTTLLRCLPFKTAQEWGLKGAIAFTKINFRIDRREALMDPTITRSEIYEAIPNSINLSIPHIEKYFPDDEWIQSKENHNDYGIRVSSKRDGEADPLQPLTQYDENGEEDLPAIADFENQPQEDGVNSEEGVLQVSDR